MSLVNPIDYTGFSSPFRSDLVVNQQNRSEAYKKAGAFKKVGEIGGGAAASFGNAIGEQFKIDAGQYAQQQGQTAKTVSGLFNLAGGIGGFAAQGGFGSPATEFSQPVVGQPGARETIGGYGGNEFFKPSEIPGFDYTPIRLNR